MNKSANDPGGTLGSMRCECLKTARPDRPLSFSECVEPSGFEIPKDAHGDRLKASFNPQPQCRVRSDRREVSFA